MIGIVAKTIDHRVIEEFFQLFKTPWELVQQGRQYDVVIAASEDIPDVDTRLLIVFRSQRHEYRFALRDHTGPARARRQFYVAVLATCPRTQRR